MKNPSDRNCSLLDAVSIYGEKLFSIGELLSDGSHTGDFPIIAGWIVNHTYSSVEVIDGSGQITVASVSLQGMCRGDLLLLQLRQSYEGFCCERVECISRCTSTARQLISEWDKASIETRYKHRYLDLRTLKIGQNLRASAQVRWLFFEFFRSRGFIYVDTPVLSRTQCEYSDDDYLVLSRHIPRGIYSLPQSAQLYKQLLVGSGIWRYFQFSRCFRDEPQLPNTLTEFNQVDVEVAFTTESGLLNLLEEAVCSIAEQFGNIRLKRPFVRISLEESLAKYGTDKPNLSSDGLPVGTFITDISMGFRKESGLIGWHHHPMMAPDPSHLPLGQNLDLVTMRSTGFDLVISGIEIASGNMRIHESELQHRILDALEFTTEVRKELLGTLLKGLEFAFPPHGGFGIGFERFLSILLGEPSIHDVVAFPKLHQNLCPLTESPFLPPKEILAAFNPIVKKFGEFAEVRSNLKNKTSNFGVPSREEVAPVVRIIEMIRQRGGCDFPMHIGDSHLPAPASFVNALGFAAKEKDLYRYSFPDGIPELRTSIAEQFGKKIGRPMPVERVLITPGATEATYAVIRACLNPGDNALLLSPYWLLIRGQVLQHGCTIREVPFFKYGNTPRVDEIEHLLKHYTDENTRLLYLASPNNPDGSIISRDVMEALLQFAERHDLWILSDEVYEQQVYDNVQFVSPLALSFGENRIISVNSFSKSFGMAGIRVGYLTAPKELVPRLGAILQHTIYCVSALLQRACVAILNDEEFLRFQMEIFDSSRRATAQALGIKPPAGGVYHFIKVNGDGNEIATSILEEVGVAVCPGSAFGSEYREWLRICFTSIPPDKAVEGSRLVANWLRERAV